MTFHVGKVSFQTFARCDEITAVFYSQYNDQSPPFFLCAYPVAVAYVFSHAEAVTVLHPVNDNEDRLYATAMMQLIE